MRRVELAPKYYKPPQMTTLRFFLGDDNGQLKLISCSQSVSEGWKIEANTLNGGKEGKLRGILQLAVHHDQVVATRIDGSVSLFSCLINTGTSELVKEWQEDRFKPRDKFVGLGITPIGQVMTCTNAGGLRLHDPGSAKEDGTQTTVIPGSLCDWIMSDDAAFFAYGGEEVEVSLWDVSRAFEPSRKSPPLSAVGSKRKKTELIDGEIWRAKNVSNDFLNLRQPVHNTCLAFLPTSSTSKGTHHILAGTLIGSIRRYDTRAAKKPVADWKDVGKIGGVKKVQRGNNEHEIFIADHGGNLSALDIRTGRILYSYNGIAGTICSIASTSSLLSHPVLVSVSLDRYLRLHSTPHTGKGKTLEKLWIKSAAQCVAWDGNAISMNAQIDEHFESDNEDNIWHGIPNVEDEEEGPERNKKRRRSR